MRLKSYLFIEIFLVICLMSSLNGLGTIQPTADISLSVTNYNSPTLVTFKFQLTTKLLSKYYMMVHFPSQWSTVTVNQCVYGDASSVKPFTQATSCSSTLGIICVKISPGSSCTSSSCYTYRTFQIFLSSWDSCNYAFRTGSGIWCTCCTR